MRWAPPAGLLADHAVLVARQADAVVLVLGLKPELEGEALRLELDGFRGSDRTRLDLPASQQRLLERVVAVAHAVDAGEGRMLLAGGYNAGSAMLQIVKQADGTYGVTELFKNPEFGSHTQPPILHKDHFYTQYTTNERRDGLVCISMSGQVKWKTGQDPAFVRGGAILVDGLLLATDGSKKLYLIEPDPAGFKTLASAELMEPW